MKTDIDGSIQVEGTAEEMIDFLTMYYKVKETVDYASEKIEELKKRVKTLENKKGKKKGGKRGRPKKNK